MAAAALALYLPLLALGAIAVWRRPLLALYAFVAGLALHNLAMALLYDAGVRGAALTAVAAWKEVLLGVALVSAALPSLRARRLPFAPGAVDALALAFAAVVGVYALVPQDVLGGSAGAGAIAHGVRHALAPVGAYLLGRVLALGADDLRRLAAAVVGVAVAVAGFGLVELYAVSLDWWRSSGAPGWYREQLGLEYRGLSGLPENFVYNPGDERPLRRLVSTFLSPLASAYLFVVALLVLAARPWRTRWLLAPAAPIVAALLLTHTRAAFLALAGGLLVLAAVSWSAWPVAGALATLVLGAAILVVYQDVAPRTSFTPAELRVQRENARRAGDTDHGAFDPDEPSLASHWRSLRDGAETVARHPQGYGPGNAGTVARRFDERSRAGESSYAELGVQLGIVGLLLFVAWNAALLLALARGAGEPLAAGLAAALGAVLALAVQTDVLGVPWLAFVLWGLGGAAARSRPVPEAGIVQDMSTLRTDVARGG
ncbi:MAG: hypothetical protein ICV64_10100 [Thermoleophilia bacterium]|nr:hypothetical protein [Thermoleophilia bacterium]